MLDADTNEMKGFLSVRVSHILRGVFTVAKLSQWVVRYYMNSLLRTLSMTWNHSEQWANFNSWGAGLRAEGKTLSHNWRQAFPVDHDFNFN